MKTVRKISERADKNKKKIKSPSKGRSSPKIKKDEVCAISDVVLKEPVYCCDDECCC